MIMSAFILPVFTLCCHVVVIGLCPGTGNSHEPFDFTTMEKLSNFVAIVSVKSTTTMDDATSEMNPDFYRRFVSTGKVLFSMKGCKKGDVFRFEHFRLRKSLINHSSFPRFTEAMNRKLDELPMNGTIELPCDNEVFLVYLKRNVAGDIYSPATSNSDAEYSFHRLDGKNNESDSNGSGLFDGIVK